MKLSSKILSLAIAFQVFFSSSTNANQAYQSQPYLSPTQNSSSENIEFLDKLIIFGDSLSDTGNLYKKFLNGFPLSPPYHEGHFSNGQIWVDFIKTRFNIPSEALINYSHGGSRLIQSLLPIPGLEAQVDKYIEVNNRKVKSSGLYIMWIGANDIVFDKQSGVTPDIDKMQQTLTTQIEKLVLVGARHFLILELPNLGFSPEAFQIDKKNGNSDYSQKLQKLSNEYNTELGKGIKKLAAKYPDVTLESFNTYSFFEDMIKNSKDYGVLNTQDRCNPNWYITPIEAVCTNPDEYAFWDAVHPTSRSHQLLEEGLSKKMNEAGYLFPNQWSLSQEDINLSYQHQKAIDDLASSDLFEKFKLAIFDFFK